VNTTGPRRIAWLRVLVGLTLALTPKQALRLATNDISGSMLLLMRTIGIRDLVIGVGALSALRSGHTADARRWVIASLASDALDVIAGLTSAPLVGRGSALLATGMAAPLAAADLWVLMTLEVTRPAT
jgi:uncharacterized protein YjeT (DUF2065 family)